MSPPRTQAHRRAFRAAACFALLGLATAAGAQAPANPPPPEERILAEAFPDLFELERSVEPHLWTVDLNRDKEEDLVLLVKSKTKVSDAWLKLPISNPPFELVSAGEITENPTYQPQYSIRPGERYLIVVHGREPGWREMSIMAAFILQDVAELPPEPTSFDTPEGEVAALKFWYEGKPGLLYWGGDRYVAALKDE